VVADDDPHLCRSLRHMLESMGLHVDVTFDGAVLLDVLAQGPHDLVLVDAEMPPPSGLDVLRRQRAAGDATPYVVMTSQLPSVTAALRGLGGVLVLEKPFGLDALRAALATALRVPEAALERGRGEAG